jgi:hypothetical protein
VGGDDAERSAWKATYAVEDDGRIMMRFGLEDANGDGPAIRIRPADALANAQANAALAGRLMAYEELADVFAATIGRDDATTWLTDMIARLPDWTMRQSSA